MQRLIITSLGLGWMLFWGMNVASAQPSRQTPPLTPYFPPSTPAGYPDPNSRVRPSANQIGNQSTDIYAKNGYPKMLGDAVEQGSATGGSAIGTAGVAGQSGSFGGGALGGSISGGGGAFGSISGGGIGGGGFGGGGQTGGGLVNRNGITGGGFTGGLMPKGFGFGGTPDFTKTWAPLSGGPHN
jgi:hypothetical protein